MLKGYYKIDGIDIYSTFNAFILRGSYNTLLSYPTRVEPDLNYWFEENEIEYDLTEMPVFESVPVSMSFFMSSDTASDLLAKRQGFLDLIKSSGYREFEIKGINRTIELRYIDSEPAEASPISYGNRFYFEFTLNFSNDSPLSLFPVGGGTFDFTFDDTFNKVGQPLMPTPYFNHNFFSLNGRDFREYGLSVKSFNGSALTLPAMKEPLLRTFKHRTGISADVQGLSKVKHPQITMACIMGAETVALAMSNYSILFNDMNKAGALLLDSQLGEFSVFYKQQSDFSISGVYSDQCFLEFNLTFNRL